MWKKLALPATIIGAVIAVYLLFRKSPLPVASAAPNPSGSGLSPNIPSVQQYDVAPARLQPSPLIQLMDPFRSLTPPSPGTQARLTFNFPPAGSVPDSKLSPVSAGCGGCKSPCDNVDTTNNQQFTDGAGAGKMQTTRRKLIQQMVKHDPNIMDRMEQNLISSGQVDPFNVIQMVAFDTANKNSHSDAPPATPLWNGPLFGSIAHA